MAKYDITTRTSRRALPSRREPYWHRLCAGGYLGYRRSQRDEHGQWIGRWRDPETGKQVYHALGFFHDFDPAKQACEKWLQHVQMSGNTDVVTVADALEHYIERLQSIGKQETATDQAFRFRAHILNHPIAKRKLTDLKAFHIAKWRDGLSGKPATINRIFSSLKAALNLAYKENLVSVKTWASVPMLRVGDDGARDRWLNADERRALLDRCGPELSLFVKVLLLTAARCGEVAAAKVGDYDKRAGTLKLSGKTGLRTIPLSSAAIVICDEASRDKLPAATLFTDPNGKAWNRATWSRAFRQACNDAGLDTSVSMYTLRHSSISELIQSGMDAFTVARMAGTSTAQIDRHYGHLAAHRTREQLNEIRLI